MNPLCECGHTPADHEPDCRACDPNQGELCDRYEWAGDM